MSEKYTMILTNCRDDNEADYITQALFEDKLVACVQTNKVHSHYFWKGKVMHDSEIRLLIKTKKKTCSKKLKPKSKAYILMNYLR